MEKFHVKIFFRSNFLYLQKNIHITENMFITLAPDRNLPLKNNLLPLKSRCLWINCLTPSCPMFVGLLFIFANVKGTSVNATSVKMSIGQCVCNNGLFSSLYSDLHLFVDKHTHARTNTNTLTHSQTHEQTHAQEHTYKHTLTNT